jgi:hypothetical protein
MARDRQKPGREMHLAAENIEFQRVKEGNICDRNQLESIQGVFPAKQAFGV